MNNNIAVVDLFCGVGGLTCGLRQAGLNVVAGIDFDSSCEYAYKTNNKTKFIQGDIEKYPAEELKNLYGEAEVKILVGCAPCQTFSRHAQKNKKRMEDKRWHLLDSFANYIKEIEPDIVSMENVPGLIKTDVFTNFINTLENLDYKVSFQVVDCSKYGMPQKRKRLVLLASKYGKINLISPTNKIKTVRDVLGNLAPIKAGGRDEKDLLHRCAGLKDINITRIKASRPGGSWAKDWKYEMRPDCYKRMTGLSWTDVYGRMEWDKPSPTMTTKFFSYGTGRFGHPEQNRALSLREGALLQTFPQDYRFFENEESITIGTIARHIGNAVPVELGRVIGKSIKKHLKGV
ncbi:MAG: DNA cytosine methyltransferase [Rickettsiales bacterium]|nr:MAG: DNA cytosine methyltransferase [Rickettsiales bacterium]